MISFPREVEESLMQLAVDNNVLIGGKIAKVIRSDNTDFQEYLKKVVEKEKSLRLVRLSNNKQTQKTMQDLKGSKAELEGKTQDLEESKNQLEVKATLLEEKVQENRVLVQEIQQALEVAETAQENAEQARILADSARIHAEKDLQLLQQKRQFDLVEDIVQVALKSIMGLQFSITILYIVALITEVQVEVIGDVWANTIGILITNFFSIIGTILGVKYALNPQKEPPPTSQVPTVPPKPVKKPDESKEEIEDDFSDGIP